MDCPGNCYEPGLWSGALLKTRIRRWNPYLYFYRKNIGKEVTMDGKRWLVFLVIAWGLQQGVHGQSGKSMTREAYIRAYRELAMKEMVRVGIPASITLAQACLESDNGNSRLATRGNNHFGIKCHDWTGKKIYQDDDDRHECFRSYNSPYESFMDHSYFLCSKPRYAPLFDLKPRDYRGWAKGLKKAGYATAPNYASLLIQIIEDNELYRYDLLVLENGMTGESDIAPPVAESRVQGSRSVMVNNKIEYIVVEPGDTPESLRKEMDLYANEIYRYNDLYKGEKLEPGHIIYLQPKRRKAAIGNEIHVVDAGQTMYDISQIYGVKLKHLYRMNLMTEGAQPLEGSEIYLRRKKRGITFPPEPSPEPVEEEEMRFILDE
jgi:LysM repeat protein